MRQITLRVPEDVLETVDERAEERGVSRSEYIRERLTEGVSRAEHAKLRSEHDDLQSEHAELQAEHDALRDRVEELEDELESAEARNDDLRRQLREANSRNDDVDEIVGYVEEERHLQRRRAEREREREEAGLLTRGKWWLFGRDLGEDDRDDRGGEDGS